jgi:peroxiredoxin Q/BCP
MSNEVVHERLHPGQRAPAISLPGIDGSLFDSEGLRGQRHMLAFFRFAACPFCNLRISTLVGRHGELKPGFPIVAIFESPLDHLRKHAEGHRAPFPILADEGRVAYGAYAIERSLAGTLKGMVTRMPTLVKAMRRGFLPTSIKGGFTTMPADFLVDEAGVVQVAHYGRDEGDHLAFEAIRDFSWGAR